MVRILAIGNSFSVDALHYFSQIADAAGIENTVLNLYIGGCSLQRHAENLKSNTPDYTCYRNGVETVQRASIREALQEADWDIITVQQASHDSGILNSYEPYGTELISCIRELAPDAKIWFHKTWAYEHGSDHPLFPRYDCDQSKMYQAICYAAQEFAQQHGLPVIPSGDVIQQLRQLPEFDYENGGVSLCRDTFHMSMTYGRYAVAAAWYEKLLGGNILDNSFAPEDTDLQLMAKIKHTVHEICKGITV